MKKLLTLLLICLPIVLSAQSNSNPIDKTTLIQLGGGLAVGAFTDAITDFTYLNTDTKAAIIFLTSSATGVGFMIYDHNRTGNWSFNNYSNALIGGITAIVFMEIREFALERKAYKYNKEHFKL
jgi:hypothetical protein